MEETQCQRPKSQMNANPTQVFGVGKEGMEAMLGLHQQVLHACENAGRYWFNRVNSDSELWTHIMTKMATAKSAPEAMGIYQEWMAQQLHRLADDGQRMSEEVQKITQNNRPVH
jgi:hypothetical protein